jgi:hypothetical protein
VSAAGEPRYHVKLVVECEIRGFAEDNAVERAEALIQGLLDKHAKRLRATVGGEYGDARELAPGEHWVKEG